MSIYKSNFKEVNDKISNNSYYNQHSNINDSINNSIVTNNSCNRYLNNKPSNTFGNKNYTTTLKNEYNEYKYGYDYNINYENTKDNNLSKYNAYNFSQANSSAEQNNYGLKNETNNNNNSLLTANDEYRDSTINIKQLILNENKLRSQVIKKDRLILELESKIQCLEDKNSKIKRELVDKDLKLEDLRTSITESNMIASNFKDKLNAKISEHDFYIKTSENKYLTLKDENNMLLKKLSIATKDAESFKLTNLNLTKDIKAINNKTDNLNLKLSELEQDKYNLEEELKTVLEELPDLKSKKELCEKLKVDLDNSCNEFAKIKNDNLNLYRENVSLRNQLNNLQIMLTGDNSPEKLKENIKILTEENKNNSMKFNDLNKELDEVNNNVENLTNYNKEFSKLITTELNNIEQWIDTYLVNYFIKENDIPELKEEMLNQIDYKNELIVYNRVKDELRKLKVSLNKARNNLNNELSNLFKKYNEEKAINDKLLEEKKIINIEISELKNKLIEKEKETSNYQIDIESMKNALNSQKDFNDNLNNNKNVNYDNNNNNNINNIILLIEKKVIEIIKSAKLYSDEFSNNEPANKILNMLDIILYNSERFNSLTNNENKLAEQNNFYKVELSKVKKEISNIKLAYNEEIIKLNNSNELLNKKLNANSKYSEDQISLLKSIIKEKEEENKKLLNEINNTNTNIEFNNNNNNQQSNMSNCLIDKNLILKLEKKIVHLQRDIDLKSIQINSQEQMLTRRNQEIADLKKILNKINEENNVDQNNNSTLKALSNELNNINSNQDLNKIILENNKLINDNASLDKTINKLNNVILELKEDIMLKNQFIDNIKQNLKK